MLIKVYSDGSPILINTNAIAHARPCGVITYVWMKDGTFYQLSEHWQEFENRVFLMQDLEFAGDLLSKPRETHVAPP